ncbi:hypothetical protein AYO38_08395 [bacterium SCGC AG-212-C10]|nr:hypothetical protein AYO38_08395 [bacterium SCGC AG-212-C10]
MDASSLRPSYRTIVIGSGAAGLFVALETRSAGPVLVLTKAAITDSNTRWAQGGVAAAIGPTDSPALHLADTIAAGAGIVDEAAARVLCEDGPARIADLMRYGVPFDSVHDNPNTGREGSPQTLAAPAPPLPLRQERGSGGEGGSSTATTATREVGGESSLTSLSLGREAAHSASRIVHAGGDRTGAGIEFALAAAIAREEIHVLERAHVSRLLVERGVVTGVAFLDGDGREHEVPSQAVVLATGGAGQLFSHTTNPAVATGDGVALAFEAGAEVADMEFYQFHPTAFRRAGSQPFLISEAVRGEGAILRNAAGEAFMSRYHDLRDLAPRDVVARAIVREMRASSSDHVTLDCTGIRGVDLAARFPGIFAFCESAGIDMRSQPIPIAPAAHYFMGGVRTDLWGRTTIPGLYACGEVACTGVHGANRLASNSLLETVVFGRRVACHIASGNGGSAARSPVLCQLASNHGAPPTLSTLRQTMWECAGIERDVEGLRRGLKVVGGDTPADHHLVTGDGEWHERQRAATIARLMLTAALQRTESRGAHYRSDFPNRDDEHWQRRQVFRRAD